MVGITDMTYKGYVDHFLYYNSQNGYGVIELDTSEEDLICTGIFAGISQGMMIEIEGEVTVHPSYGEQIKVSSVHEIEMEGIIDIERYLASGAIKGVGPSIAKRIIKKFGEDTFRIIEEEPERLSEIKGISERMAQDIAVQVLERKELRDIIMYLQKYGISNNLAIKLYDKYGSSLKSIIEANPYQLAEDIEGIGFKTADSIAEKMGIRVDSEHRIHSGIQYVLSIAEAEGHTFLPKDMLLSEAYEILGVPVSLIEAELPNLIMEKKIIIKTEGDSENCYLSRMYFEELGCARMLFELNMRSPAKNEEKILSRIEKIEKSQNVELDELQRKSVMKATESSVFILTGGPGTGKTTTINTIIRYFYDEGLDILLAAPTGRAAKRMTEATGYEAKTIHRLLELSGSAESGRKAVFERNADCPLEADVVIIDEMSMVDIHLFYALLKAVAPGTRLILVGDENQLPSVGPGQVLKDLMRSGVFAHVELSHIFRQDEKSDIITNAHKINKGEDITLGTDSKDFLFLERDDVNVIYKHMVLLATEKLPGYVDATPMQIQILTPTRIGALGAPALNKVLQDYFNPPDVCKKEYQYRETLYRVGDKVMQIKNNYTLQWKIMSKYNIPIDEGSGVFNGDMGIVVGINTSAQLLTVEYDEKKQVEYPFSGLDELELAYAITIHKSQGSEYPAVIIPLLGGPRPLLNRNLLYTGVTRAKKCVTILGSRDTVGVMIHNEDERKRYSGLSSRIKEVERAG